MTPSAYWISTAQPSSISASCTGLPICGVRRPMNTQAPIASAVAVASSRWSNWMAGIFWNQFSQKGVNRA
ncbi:hypothetical protein AA13594_2350 [Gluconacetobacter azotocaptans DSM 13594]|nr:hypothetical protein AA13594_2350 [Gluconacetobacter azotocaptans DSM 13594]